MFRARLAFVVGALVWLVAASANAHGRFPATGQIAFHPSDPDVIAVRTTFGLLLSNDGGERWQWVCQSVMSAGLNEDPAINVMSDGSIVATVFDGVVRGTEGGCIWDFPSSELDGTILIDQAPHPTDPASSFVVTSEGNAPIEVWSTSDDGVSWSQLGNDLGPAPYISERIAVAPSNPDRLYVSGSIPPGAMVDPTDGGMPDGGMPDAGMDGGSPDGGTITRDRRAIFYRSTDAGKSWDGFDVALREHERNIHVLGVDPTDPDHVLMRVAHDARDFPTTSDRLIVSTDGGESWSDVMEVKFLNGFVWSDDGETVWVGGNDEGGLYRSDDGGGSFDEIADLQVGCLSLRDDGELWACAENFSDGFALGRSADGGESFEPVLVFDRIEGLLECSEGAPTASVCGPEEPDLIRDLGLEGADAGTGDGGGGDGGSGGGCAIAHGSPRAPAAAALVALAIALLRRRRRGVG